MFRIVLATTAMVLSLVASSQAQEMRERGDPYFPSPGSRTGEPQRPAPGSFDPGSRNNDASPKSTPLPGLTASSSSIDSADATPLAEFQPGRILARVADQPIFVADLALEARQLIDEHIQDAPEKIKQQEFEKLIPRMLPKYIQAKALYVDTVNSLPEGAKLSDVLKSAEEQFDESVLPKLVEKSGVESAAMLDAQYRALGTSLRRTRRNWAENELVKYMIRSKLEIDQEISHKEIHDLWLAERDTRWAVPARVHWERISVRLDQFPSRQKAWDALAEMGNTIFFGGSFAAVSKKGSQDPLANEGGDQGWASRGSLADKALEELLFTMPVNELSEIRDTGRGFEIVRVIERTDAGHVPFEEAQREIREKILDERREAAFKKYFDQVASRVPVETFEGAPENIRR